MKRLMWSENAAASEIGYSVGLEGRWPTDAEVARFYSQRLRATFRRAMRRGKKARASRVAKVAQ
jgi:hypothetical protein